MNEQASFPHSFDSEKGLLCSLAMHPALFDEAAPLDPALFYIPAHRMIFQHLLDTYQDDGTTDFIIVRDSFRLTEIAEIGGLQYLSEVYGFVPTAANWRFYLEQMIDTYERRVTIQAANLLVQRCFDVHSECSIPIRDLCEKALVAIALSHNRSNEEYFNDLVRNAIAEVSHRRSSPGTFIEISGIRALDLAMGGVLPGEQVVIGAETSYGKTALALQIAAHVSLGKQQKKVAIFSMEMSKQALAERMMSAQSGVRLRAVRTGELSEEENKKIDQFASSVPGGRTIDVEDAYNLDIAGIISRCRKLKATGELDMVIVDYLQLVSPAITRDSSRQREVADISRRLKVLAGELGVVVVALSQLNDEGKLRESRAIGQDADFVLIIKDAKDSEDAFHREILILKARNGPRGEKVLVDFYGDYASFSSKAN
jgi:replicative DNA helicase